jgi:hypothetical protein
VKTLRLVGVGVIASFLLLAHALAPRPVHLWSTAITAMGEIQIGELGPLEAIVQLQPDPLVLTDEAQGIEALVEIPSADVALLEPSSIRLSSGTGDGGGIGAAASSFQIDAGAARLIVGFADLGPLALPNPSDLPPEGHDLLLSVSGLVGGRTFVGSDSITLLPPSMESTVEESPSPTDSESPPPDPEDSPGESPSSEPEPDASPSESPPPEPAPQVSPADEPTPGPGPAESPTPQSEPEGSPTESPAPGPDVSPGEPPPAASPDPDDEPPADVAAAPTETPAPERSDEASPAETPVASPEPQPAPTDEVSPCADQSEVPATGGAEDAADVAEAWSECEVIVESDSGEAPASGPSSAPSGLPILVPLALPVATRGRARLPR